MFEVMRLNKKLNDDNKDTLYIITGAAGHLAGTIIRYLENANCRVRGLILPSEKAGDTGNTTYYKGDVTKEESLNEIFSGSEDYETIVIHAAAMISISDEAAGMMYDINVNGTKNIIRLCEKHKVKRLVYVGSVDALPEKPGMAVITEVDSFPAEKVEGAYAKTKAEASQAVLEASRSGLDAVIVMPSGIIGPYDDGRNHMVQLVRSYINGKLPAGITGGYDFVDVRDVAKGCIAAAHYGEKGECYILSNRYCSVKHLLEYMRIAADGRKKFCVSAGFVKLLVPMFEWVGKLTKKRPLVTRFSLNLLKRPAIFSHDKATMQLKYSPRDLKDTIADTVNWIKYRRCELN
ncbi:MAG: NAD-dependent epimerase/dehydratase family protein [Oscillospiraceae bacterium]|jgi:dihydroflavonol-4-reductase